MVPTGQPPTASRPGAGQASVLARALRGLGSTRVVLRTGRGYRVGIAGEREPIVELAGKAPGIERYALRPTSLEDVYFARTQDAGEVAAS